MSNTAAEYRKLSLLPPGEWTDEHADRLLEILALAQHDEQLALDIE